MTDEIYIESKNISDGWIEGFEDKGGVLKPIIESAKISMEKIKQFVLSSKSFIDAVKRSVPEDEYRVLFTDEQRKLIKNSAVEFMHRKDGSIMAKLIRSDNKKICFNLNIEKVNGVPKEISAEAANFAAQMQLAQIAEQIEQIQISIEEVLRGQQLDRLAYAYSCEQKLLQAQNIKNPTLKATALIQIAHSAEDSRNKLMQSQTRALKNIKEYPTSNFGKFFKSNEKIKRDMDELRESIAAINQTSLVEALAYRELGEYEALRESLMYYSKYISDTYFLEDGLTERLDQIDNQPDNYWTTALPRVVENINALPSTIIKEVTTNEEAED